MENLPPDEKLKIISEVRDKIEVVHTSEYASFLQVLMEPLLSILLTTEATFVNNDLQKLRNSVLELIYRFPVTETLKAYAKDLIRLLMNILLIDNEENGVVCLKIIAELHKSYSSLMEDQVLKFLEIVQRMYENMTEIVPKIFNVNCMLTKESSVHSKIIHKSMNSFKVLTECPIIMALLFQLHRNIVSSVVHSFVVPIIKTLHLQPEQQVLAHANASKENKIFLGMAPTISNRTLYNEFKSLQVKVNYTNKTLSFLAFISKSFMQTLKPYQDQIVDGVMNLFKDCPEEGSNIRKELLAAARQFWSVEFRTSFVRYIDLLLNDDILIGTGVSARESLKALGHQGLIDMLINIRPQLNLNQIGRVIIQFSKDLHDDSIPPQNQTQCVVLLCGIAENLALQNDQQFARKYLVQILHAFSQRLNILREILPLSLKFHEERKNGKECTFADMPVIEISFDLGIVQPIRSSSKQLRAVPNLVKDMKDQFKKILFGIKSILVVLSNMKSPESSRNSLVSFAEESEILCKVFRNGLHCFEFYFVDPDSGENKAAQFDDKEVVEAFAGIYNSIDLAMFQETCCQNIDHLFNMIERNPYVLAIPQSFLSSSKVSTQFSGPLLKFLMNNFDEIGGENVVKSTVMLRLFKLLFNALTIFPEDNELVFKPHLANIIMSSLKTTAKDPSNYFLLLRALFRSIGGGKFEKLYAEVLPLLQILLETLNFSLLTSQNQQMRELFVELCLTVPVRLSQLLPHLSYLMRPLVIALHSGPELVNQSLKTLELCIDNLTQDFLEPIFAPVMDDLMGALWKHLQPAPYNPLHSVTTLRILGKFGGRNRRLLRDNSPLTWYPKMETLTVSLNFDGIDSMQSISLADGLESAKKILSLPTSDHYPSALQFLKSCTPLFFEANLDESELKLAIHNLLKRFKMDSNSFSSENMCFVKENSEVCDPFPEELGRNLGINRSLDLTVGDWLLALFFAASIPSIAEESWVLIESVIRHFVLFSIDETISFPRPEINQIKQGYDILTHYSNSKSLCFVRAIVNGFSEGNSTRREVAEKALSYFHECCVGLLGSGAEAEKLIVFRLFVISFEIQCYQSEWYQKAGGCLGLSVICSSKFNFSLQWLLDYELEIVKALLFVLKDSKNHIPYFESDTATSTLENVLRSCNTGRDLENNSHTSKFNSLVVVLISELSNSNQRVRKTVQSSLNLLADLGSISVTELLLPVREKLLYPIFAKPLRALPFAMQIGYIDAVTYCLSLKPTLISFSEELGRLLQEALALAETEESPISGKENHYKNATSLKNLKVECIKLLSAVMYLPELSTAKLTQTRSRIIQLFFKCLYSMSPEIIQVANSGLTEVLELQLKLPKELLQSGLKPILANLTDHKKLTVAGLQGLQRLLELLTHYFKIEIGKRLLEHLKEWSAPQSLRELSAKPLLNAEPILIIAATLDVFYRLPPAAKIFMEDLVTKVIDLETVIRRTVSSPFRLPLLRFMNRYAHEGFIYFIERFANPSYASLFCNLLLMDLAGPLKAETLKNADLLKEKLFDINLYIIDDNNRLLLYNSISLLATIMELDKSWLIENGFILPFIKEIWKSERTWLIDPYHNSVVFSNIVKLLIVYFENDVQQTELFFDILNGLDHPMLLDQTYLKNFLFEFTKSCEIETCMLILDSYLDILGNDDFTMSLKSLFSRFFIVPMLMLQENASLEELFSSHIVDKLLATVWEPSNEELMNNNALKLEMLQLTTLIIYRVPNSIHDHLKEIIKYAWSHLQIEDIILKQAAYVLLCRFIKEYDTPVRIVTQTYVAQLRAHQVEVRPMVKQALDSLLPALHSHEGMNSTEGGGVPKWVGWICKTILEEGGVSQMISIFQLLVRNEEYVFANRKHFLHQTISSLSRFGLSANSTSETKTLSVDLADLLLKWELRALENKGSGDMDVDGEEENQISDSNRELILSFLIRFCLSLTDNNPEFKRALDILVSFYRLWEETPITLAQLCKVASMEFSETNQNQGYILNASQILKVTVESKSDPWLIEKYPKICQCLEKWSACDNEQILDSFSLLLSRLGKAFDNNRSHKESSDHFFKLMDTKLKERLKSMTIFGSVTTILEKIYLDRCHLQPVSQLIREHLVDLINLLSHLVSEDAIMNANEKCIGVVIKVLNSQINYLGELRKTYFGILSSIIDQKDASGLHEIILNLLRTWTNGKQTEAFPTIKEKCNIAVKMIVFESYSNKRLFEDYMSLVADIYEEEVLARSELTVRLEPVFLAGTKLANSTLRSRFSDILDKSLPANAKLRLSFVLGIHWFMLGGQNWNHLADSFWIAQATDILLGAIQHATVYNSNVSLRFPLIKFEGNQRTTMKRNMFVDEFIYNENVFLNSIRVIPLSSLTQSLRQLIHTSNDLGFKLWGFLFSSIWSNLNGADKHDMLKRLVILLAKDYHVVQANLRPNVIQALLEGACAVNPPLQLPPQLVRYLGRTYNCWHVALKLLEITTMDDTSPTSNSSKDEEKLKESFLDALADLYSELGEADYFAGLWRRRCLFIETNTAISYEQCGKWEQAQKFYELAQSKARSCVLPFSESEYNLWEKRWISASERLQQWDILSDLSKHESKPTLLLESLWRLSDWNTEKVSISMTLQSISHPPTPRKKLFEAFLLLNKHGEVDSAEEFKKVCEEGIQLVLKKWHSLPRIVCDSHTPVFHHFQQFVELHEASIIQNNLRGTNVGTIDSRSSELKNCLSSWRDRLPNTWDDLSIWSDLVAWRQHVFSAVNKAYLPLISQITSPATSFAYRGYHETAWLINRFAHVARKHSLADVCISALHKIYTLPNIEIQEAFYKLREQVKCHKDILGEYSVALEVVSNTNLSYFTLAQKAEFYNLKGTFFAKLSLPEKAREAFECAIQIDPNLPHCWASFAEFNDRLFTTDPTNVQYAAEAVTYYLTAASMFNDGRCRRMLSRILWLLSLDDESGTIMNNCNNFKGEPPTWYWITFIPELIGSLAGKEAKFARNLLMNIAKTYPQALHYQLRTAKEDFAAMKRQLQQPTNSESKKRKAEDSISKIEVNTGDVEMEKAAEPKPKEERLDTASDSKISQQTPWDNIEDIMAILKTAFPLLALTMETLVDQIIARLKPSTDEDIYRLIVALLNDGVQMYLSNLAKHPDTGGPLSSATESSLVRFAESMSPNHIKYKEAFERDFITSKPNLSQLVDRFRTWRDNLETLLDLRPQEYHLEHFSQYLAEFEYSKFDEIEIPGQYFLMKDSSKDFSRIERFDPVIRVFRGHSGSHRRIVIKGHDGSVNKFIIQHPAVKQCRREERTQQLFRLLNGTLERNIQTRKRNLTFNLPVIIPLAPQIRLVQDDHSNVSLQEIFESFAKQSGFRKDDPIKYYTDRLKSACLTEDLTNKTKVEIVGLKAEINSEIAQKMIPETIVSKYFAQKMGSFEDLWTLRKRFTSQMACVTFMSYLLSIGQRIPQKIYISQSSGLIWLPDLFSTISQQSFLFTTNEAVPFRLTPNLQNFMTPVGMEGLFVCSISMIANALSSPDVELYDYLAVFIRDELMTWQSVIRKPLGSNTSRLRELVNQNIQLVLNRAQQMSCSSPNETEKVEPLFQNILDLISQATNPLKLAQMDISYLPQL